VRNYGAGDLLEIALSGRRETELVPFTQAFVPEVSINDGRVVVRMPAPPDQSDGPGDSEAGEQ